MNLPIKNTHILSFSHKLFLSVISIFLVFAACFITYQYHREKEYKIALLDIQLQDYNARLYEKLGSPLPTSKEALNHYTHTHSDKDVRVTIITLKGEVVYDSQRSNDTPLANHLDRVEVQKALAHTTGYDVRRTSQTTGVSYFYSATRYSNYLIRSAKPYDVSLTNNLKADSHYLWFTATVTLLLLLFFYKFTNKLGTAVSQLREFAMRADRNQPIEMDIQTAFPNNELGEISGHIIRIYKRLQDTKEALYMEREKLITHLQISREGLGVFNKDKKEILVNNLFIHYTNQLSDANLQSTEEIFAIDELQQITNFINKAQRHPLTPKEKRMAITINKNGKTFVVECITFQDADFEISINDITQEEEQMRLKRQLTQNIAHELKTPVSSIQGYLETIVSTPNIPPEKTTLFLQRCYAQSNRLSRLLRDISVLTRMDEAADMTEMEPVDFAQLVGSIINEVSLELEEKHITVRNSLTQSLPLRGNHSLLYSIVRNLMDNAIAYAGSDIEIHISCFRQDAQFYYFSFCDTGIGVAPQHLHRLFERFYRVDKGRSRKLGGTGLGLAIVKNAVLIHGGSISAKNNPSGGVEFVFTLAKER